MVEIDFARVIQASKAPKPQLLFLDYLRGVISKGSRSFDRDSSYAEAGIDILENRSKSILGFVGQKFFDTINHNKRILRRGSSLQIYISGFVFEPYPLQ